MLFFRGSHPPESWDISTFSTTFNTLNLNIPPSRIYHIPEANSHSSCILQAPLPLFLRVKKHHFYSLHWNFGFNRNVLYTCSVSEKSTLAASQCRRFTLTNTNGLQSPSGKLILLGRSGCILEEVGSGEILCLMESLPQNE